MTKSPRRKSASKLGTPIEPGDVRSGSRSLSGKRALITGGTQGIGLAVAHALAGEGCSLVLCGRDRTRLVSAEAELRKKGAHILALPCDVRDENSVAKMFATIRNKSSSLDIVVNSAGIAHSFKPVAELSLKEWDDVLAANLTGTFLVTRAALPFMSRGGSIVNVLSMSSKRAFPNLAAYNASKFGALGFTNTLREELRPQGIRVISLLPGSTDTPIWNTLWPDAPRHKMMRSESVAQALIAALKLPPETTVEEIDLMPTGGPL